MLHQPPLSPPPLKPPSLTHTPLPTHFTKIGCAECSINITDATLLAQQEINEDLKATMAINVNGGK